MNLFELFLLFSGLVLWCLVCVFAGYAMGRRTRTDEKLIHWPEIKKPVPHIDSGGDPFNDSLWTEGGPERIETIK
jgi:hypothetical protein